MTRRNHHTLAFSGTVTGDMFMPKKSTCLPTIATATFTFFAACVGATAQTELPVSKVCSADDGGWSPAGGFVTTGQIAMSNDGGWCGQRLAVRINTFAYSGVMHLTRQPMHGEVSIMRRDNGTDVYYKPNPGYIGPDSFAVLVEVVNIEKNYDVVVKAPPGPA